MPRNRLLRCSARGAMLLPALAAVLVFGTDVGLVSERAAAVAKAIAQRDQGEIIRIEEADLEWVAAWSGPMCGGLAILPIYLAGTRLGARRIGLVAGLVFALLPISVVYTRIGNADHHAAVGMIGAWLLYTVIALVDPETPRRRMADFAVLSPFAK